MKEKIKTLKIIHFAICAGILVAYFLLGNISLNSFKIQSIDSSEMIYIAIPFLAIFLSTVLFKSQLSKTNPQLKPEDNLPIYQTASIIRWVILEAAAFLLLILNPDFQVFGLLIILYLAYIRPTEEKMNNDLNILQ